MWEGVEYNELPIPEMLVKAMSRKWAIIFVEKGKFRIRHLNYFRKWENKILGDRKDGKGQYNFDGNPIKIGSINDVYGFCMSLPEITHSRLCIFAQQCNYNCLVVIHDPKL